MMNPNPKSIISQIEQEKYQNPQKAYELCEELKEHTSVSSEPSVHGFVHMVQGEMTIFHKMDYTNAVRHLITALQYLEDTESHEYLIRSYYLLGVSFRHLQDYIRSIDYFLNALHILNLHEMPYYRCQTAYHIGIIFDRFENHEQAIEYFLLSVSLEKKNSECYTDGKSLLHLGLSMAKNGSPHDGLSHAHEGFSILRQSNSPKSSYSYAHSILAAIYYIIGNTQKSCEHFQLAEHVHESGHTFPFYPGSVLFHIRMLIQEKRFRDTLPYIDSLYEFYLSKNDHSSCSTVCHLAIQVFEALHDRQMASYYYELYFLHTQHKLRSINKIEHVSFETRTLCEQLRKSNETLARLMNIDTLTGLANKSALFKHMEELLQSGKAQLKPLGVMMFDVDKFKLINDTYGHVAGDTCLTEIGSVLKQTDQLYGTFSGRFGGDEMILAVYDKTKEELLQIAAYIHNQVRTIHIAPLAADNRCVSLSIGIYSAVPTRHDTILNFIQNADDELYKSKQCLH